MFGVWYAVNYSAAGEPQTAQAGGATELAAVREVGPLESLTASVGQGWRDVSAKFKNALGGLGSVSVEQGYQEMKAQSLHTYAP
jgi:hypothetical protein